MLNNFTEKSLRRLAGLKLGQSQAAWQAADEARQYFDEAQWALKWQLYPQARAAADAAWALGKKDPETVTALINAYAGEQFLPPYYSDGENIPVFEIPDPDKMVLLSHALDLMAQPESPLVAESNSVANFELGLKLLVCGVGTVKSYYYAALSRPGHEEQLHVLQGNLRRGFQIMDAAHPPVVRPSWVDWRYYIAKYQRLKWKEAGVCFERPDLAVTFYVETLRAGVHPEAPPRIIGWNWADRQRVPALTKTFLASARASTNVAVQLEALYLAMMLAPDDEQGSLKRSEEELATAMWDNRALLVANGENLDLLRRTETCFRDKHDIHSNGLDTNEPFASLWHRLRMDFLQTDAPTNWVAFRTLFPADMTRTESSAQAAELFPLLIKYERRFPPSSWGEKIIGSWSRDAGVAAPSARFATGTNGPARPAQQVTEMKFIPWHLSEMDDSSPDMQCVNAIVRQGKLWLLISCDLYRRHNYIEVDPQTGRKRTIPFPEDLGATLNDRVFEVSSNALFVICRSHLYRWKFGESHWQELSAPVGGAYQMIWHDNRLFIGRRDGLVTFQPDTGVVEVLASSRRQPALSPVDSVWDGYAMLYLRPDDKLGMLMRTRCATYAPDTHQWTLRELPPVGPLYRFRGVTSPWGAQQLLAGPIPRKYLVGYWNDGQPVETLLREVAAISIAPPLTNETRLQPARWDWPQPFKLEPANFTADGNQLWVLTPRFFGMGYEAEEPVKFTDDRQATLFYYHPQSRQPQTAAIRFQDSGLPGDSKQLRFPSVSWIEQFCQSGAPFYWFRTPAGLVLATPLSNGHWLVPEAFLQSQFHTPPALPANPATPGGNSSTQP